MLDQEAIFILKLLMNITKTSLILELESKLLEALGRIKDMEEQEEELFSTGRLGVDLLTLLSTVDFLGKHIISQSP